MTAREILFARVRKTVFDGHLTQGQCDGINKILDHAEARIPRLSLAQLAYLLATVTWETGRVMQPVEEAFHVAPLAKRMAYLRSKAYYPWYGRGIPQLTWKANYDKFGITNPDDALRWPVALRVCFDGMSKGSFTGKKLSDFITGSRCDFVGARRIVNGTDRASEIAAIARSWLDALVLANAGLASPVRQRATAAVTAALDETAMPPFAKPGIWARVAATLANAFFRRRHP